MSPFKEPQPRKNAAVEQDAKKVIGGVWPPYERVGGEANWAAEVKPSMKDQIEEQTAENFLLEQTRQPIMVLPEATSFEYRLAALQQAIAWNNGECTAPAVVKVADVFEDYLRNGKPPRD